MSKLNILILGAAYGLLPAVRILSAGHAVTVVCRTSEQSSIVSHGAKVTFLRRDGSAGTTLKVPATTGTVIADALHLAGSDVDIGRYDLVLLAMSEPQFAAPEIASLLGRIGQAGLPVVSLMNAVPPPFLARLGTVDIAGLRPAYSAWEAWKALDPATVTAASPDAQAVRTNPDRVNELSVTLGSNFKVAPFEQAAHQVLLETIARDVSAYRRKDRPLPVRILAHGALHVPMAKWPMLMAGNCRCIRPDGSIISIAEALGAEPDTSRHIYEQTQAIVRAAGAAEDDLVPFLHYARAARSLTRPSSFARAIASGAAHIERVDMIIELTGRQLCPVAPEITEVVTLVDKLMSGYDLVA